MLITFKYNYKMQLKSFKCKQLLLITLTNVIRCISINFIFLNLIWNTCWNSIGIHKALLNNVFKILDFAFEFKYTIFQKPFNNLSSIIELVLGSLLFYYSKFLFIIFVPWYERGSHLNKIRPIPLLWLVCLAVQTYYTSWYI